MAPERAKEDETPAQAGKRKALEIMEKAGFFKHPESPRAIHAKNFVSNSHLPLDDQIQLLLTPLYEEGFIGSCFYDPIASLPRLRFYELLRESVDRFKREGELLHNDLKTNLGRWDPDLKAAAVAAKGLAGIAQLICMDMMVSLGNRLEAACLSGSDPFEVYRLCLAVRDLFKSAIYKLTFLTTLLDEALCAPPAAEPSAVPLTATPPAACPDPISLFVLRHKSKSKKGKRVTWKERSRSRLRLVTYAAEI